MRSMVGASDDTPAIRRASSRRVVGLLSCAALQIAVSACHDTRASSAQETPAASSALVTGRDSTSALPAAAPVPELDAPWLVNVTSNATHGQSRDSARPLPCPPRLPEALDPPADATLELAWPASGVQIYACTRAQTSAAPSWVLEGPHAVLTAGKAVAAIHFAGPSWQGLDGSSVKAARLASADAPDTSAVPWLLMSATPIGTGLFANTTHIQRLATSGGKAPAGGCDSAHLGAKVLVPYEASYYFYRRARTGEAVHQCRSER